MLLLICYSAVISICDTIDPSLTCRKVWSVGEQARCRLSHRKLELANNSGTSLGSLFGS